MTIHLSDPAAAPPDHRQLARRAAAGSMDALGTLYDAYAPGVYRVACRLMRSDAEAEDVVQDVFVGLPRALRSWRGDGSLDAWIRQVAARTALMRLRVQRRRRENWAVEGCGVGRCHDQHTVTRVMLQRAIDQLSDELRIVFLLKVVDGYSHEEIAGMLGIATPASRARLARARKQLGHLLR